MTKRREAGQQRMDRLCGAYFEQISKCMAINHSILNDGFDRANLTCETDVQNWARSSVSEPQHPRRSLPKPAGPTGTTTQRQTR